MEATTGGDEGGALAKLRSQMVTVALRRGISRDDVEDVVQEAFRKVLAERVRPNAPSLEIRAFVALRDVRVDALRAKARERSHRGPGLDASESDGAGQAPTAQPDADIAMIETLDLVRSIAGDDVMCFALLKALGATEEDVADLMDWSPGRAAAARVQFARKKPAFVEALRPLVPEEGTW